MTDAIRVKPLVWVLSNWNLIPSTHMRAEISFATPYGISWGWANGKVHLVGDDIDEWHPTLEAAKAAAQADYEARIRSALETVSVQEAARVLLDSDGYLSDCAIHAACYCAEIDETRAIVALREGLRALAASPPGDDSAGMGG